VEKVDLLSEDAVSVKDLWVGSRLTDTQKVECARSDRLLSVHIDTTHIETDGVPYATVNPDIRFSHFASLFDASDRSHEANIWRLGVALFDELDLRLPAGSPEDLVSRIFQIRRKLALSKWLENAVSPAVDHDLLATGDSLPKKYFALLSGNQVDRAVQSALDGNDMRLATLLSQIGGPDAFRDEVARQLEDWTKYKANSLIGGEYRKLYALLAGITDITPGDEQVKVADGLDWKRAFGLRLWYGNGFEHTIGDALESYTAALSTDHSPARPLPPYLESATDKRKWNMSEPTDVLYNLVRLFSDVTIPLDDILRSRDCGPSPTDFRLPWHLYILLSRVLGKRDFADREEGRGGEEGYSAAADRVTGGYAVQLEQEGDWRMAAFVLLHLETRDG